MQIAFIHPTAPFAEGTGASHSATQIVTGLARRGHEVVVYTNNTSSPSNTSFETREITYKTGFPHHEAEEMNEAIRDLHQELSEFDLVHSYLMRTIPSMAELGEDDTRVVVTINAYGGVCPKNDLQYLDGRKCRENGMLRCAKCTLYEGVTNPGYKEGNLIDRVARMGYNPVKRLRQLRQIKRGNRNIGSIDGFHALSQHIKTVYSAFGFPESDITTIPNILDEKFEIPHQSDFFPPHRLLYVGYLKKHKGVSRLPNLMAKLRHQLEEEVTLTIAGDGNMRGELEQAMHERDVDQYVNFLGHVPYSSLPDLYASHDLFVYPGQWDEPFGRVFLEALAAGTPIVATNVGEAERIVGSAGCVVENGTEALIEGVADSLCQEKLTTYSAEANDSVNRFRQEVVLDSFQAFYSEIVQDKELTDRDRHGE